MKNGKVFGTASRVRYVLVMIMLSVVINALTVIGFHSIGWNSFIMVESRPFYDGVDQLINGRYPYVRVLHYSAPFICAVIIGFLYFFPLFNKENRDPENPVVLRKIINTPFFLFAMTVTAWIIAALFEVVTFFLVADKTGGMRPFFMSEIMPFMTGFLIGILAYYAGEFVNYNWVIPRYYSGGEVLSGKQGGRLPIRARFSILFVSVAVIPLLYINIAAYASGAAFMEIMKLSLFFLVISFLIIRFLGNVFREPLVWMDGYTRKIQKGEYSGVLPVISSDEMGRLSNSLNEMARGLAERDSIKDAFGRVVDPAVRDHLLNGHINLGGEHYEATVLFTDIRDFTSISEKLPPQQVVAQLNRYFSEVTSAIIEEGGLVNKFIGDAVLALFGVPVKSGDHAARAVRAALKIRERREILNRQFEQEGLPALNSGIGIHTGPLVAGNIGSEVRMEFTVIGDTVNVASRLESSCKTTGKDLLFSDETLKSAGTDIPYDLVGCVKVKGREEELTIYTVA